MTRAFDRILIVMFENQYRSYVMENPYMRKLAQAGCSMNNYFGAFHPSQTNYLASIAGEICGVSNDTPPASPLSQKTLVGLMQPNAYAQRISWKAYMEAYPGEAWNPAWLQPNYSADQQPINEYPESDTSLARYFRKHNAFASFHEVQCEESRWQNIVDDISFWQDINNNSLPEYSWFTPDIWNDGHYIYGTHIDTQPRYALVAQLATWLEYVFFGNISNSNLQGGTLYPAQVGLNLDLDLLMRDPQQAYAQSRIPSGTLVVVTWDEADYNATSYDTNYDGQNQVYTVLLGDMIKPGTRIETPYNHYSLIKTIERNFELPSLGKNDHDANALRFLWNEAFRWQPPQALSFGAVQHASVCQHQQSFVLVYSDSTGDLYCSQYLTTDTSSSAWQNPVALGFKASGELCLASDQEQLMLVFSDQSGAIHYSSCSAPNTAWSAPQALLPSGSHHLCLTHYYDYAEQQIKFMLAWQIAAGENIMSLCYQNGQWDASPVSVGQYSNGPMAIAALGPSLYLVYQERNSFSMRMSSYNTAPFNAIQAVSFDNKPAPQNNTSLHAWSVMDFPVGHFARKQNHYQNDYQANGALALASCDGEMRLSFRRRYEDTPQLASCLFGLTGVMTASDKASNGFGTLQQAGWTYPDIDQEIQLTPISVNCLAAGTGLWMHVYQAQNSSTLSFRLGTYQSS